MSTTFDTDEEVNQQNQKRSEIAELQAKEAEAETDALEALLDAPSADDDDLPEGHPSRSDSRSEVSPSALKKKEAEVSNEDENIIGNGFTDKPSKKPGRFSLTRQRGIVVGVIVAMIVSALTFVLSIFSGPAQLVHIAQLMDKFHFSSQEEDSNSRLFKIAKAIRNRDKPEKNRLGIVGNKLADKWTAKLKASGIELEYNKRTGLFERFVLDPETLAKNSQMEGLKNSSPDEIQTHFKENFDIDVTVDANKRLVIDGSNLSFLKARRLDKVMFRSANYSKAGAALGTRSIGARQGLTWHPIKNLDNKLYRTLDAKLTKIQEDRKARLENGEQKLVVNDAQNSADTDNDGKPDAPNEGASETNANAKEAQAAIDADTTSGESGKFSGISEKLSVKAAGGLSLATGLVCLAQGVAARYDEIQYNNVALPLMRVGMDAVATGSQVMGSLAIGKGVDIDQLGVLARKLNDPKNGGSWTNGRSVQAENRMPQTGPDVPDEARIDKESSPVSSFLNGIPGLPSICGFLGSGVGQVASFGIDILTGGPLGALFGQATSAVIMPKVTDSFVATISGDPLDVGSASGATLGNFINWGSRLSSNDAALRAGGKKLTRAQVREKKLRTIAIDQEDFSRKSLAGRIFDFTDQRSMAGKFMDLQSPNYSSNLATFASSIVNSKTSLKSFGSIFKSPSASADTYYDYGFEKIGFDNQELEDARLDDPFANATIVDKLLNDPAVKSKAEKCFGITISGEDKTVTSGGKAPSYAELDENNCGDPDFDWTRVRFYILDSLNAESYACFEGVDDQACTNVGMTASASTTPTDAQPTDGTIPTGNGKWTLAAGANRPGTSLTPLFSSFLDQLATHTSFVPIVTTGTNHSRLTTSGNVSDHYAGNGADFGSVINKFGTSNALSGQIVPRGDEIAAAAMVACGTDPAKAKAQAIKGGVYDLRCSLNGQNVRVQVLWKTDTGGNHHNHVHVGIKAL